MVTNSVVSFCFQQQTLRLLRYEYSLLSFPATSIVVFRVISGSVRSNLNLPHRQKYPTTFLRRFEFERLFAVLLHSRAFFPTFSAALTIHKRVRVDVSLVISSQALRNVALRCLRYEDASLALICASGVRAHVPCDAVEECPGRCACRLRHGFQCAPASPSWKRS